MSMYDHAGDTVIYQPLTVYVPTNVIELINLEVGASDDDNTRLARVTLDFAFQVDGASLGTQTSAIVKLPISNE